MQHREMAPGGGPSGEGVTLEEFEVLVVFSSTEHFALTAEAMQCSVSTVQRALRGLENKLHMPLLERAGRRVRLTRAGWALAEQGGRVLRARSDAIAAAAAVVDQGRTHLRIGHTFSLGIQFVPGVVAEYAATDVTSSISLRHGAATAMTTALLGGHIDAAFSSSAPLEPDITVVPLFEEGAVLAAPAAWEMRDLVPLASVAEKPFVAMPSGANSRGLLLRACSRAGFAPTVALEADDLFTVTGAVAAGIGLAVLPSHMTDVIVRGVDYLALQEPVPTTRTITLCYRTESPRSTALQQLARIARTQARTRSAAT